MNYIIALDHFTCDGDAKIVRNFIGLSQITPAFVFGFVCGWFEPTTA